ncbi:hypothetical protein BASA81_001455 [Batrachochytrium salamandrivorans]|nr:hypothetical protein BASA81_001455 [Batrachochytrium salamandrivorans]
MPSQTSVWEQATVLAVSGAMATVRTEGDDVVQLDLLTIPVYLANPSLQADVTALHYIHEPGILYNLEQRSGNSEPYTLLGSVLVAVNPLRKIPDPEGICGKKHAAMHPHPYGIAEIAFGQLVFAENRKLGGKKMIEEDVISNQSIVISGESGSGKTESSKYVLQHLVARNAEAGGHSDIDNRLLGSNPILESFGNASTLRNHNSSRFGKFLKLHFKGTPRPGDTTSWTIGGASVQTYLLERSRITSHNNGERGYHIFYQLRDGSGNAIKSQLGLDLNNSQFKYLTPREDVKIPASATKMKVNDVEDFQFMDQAWSKLGISPAVKSAVFQTLAGILHLGNVEFQNEERPEGNVAVIKPGGYGALEWAGKLLGVNANGLGLMFREHEVKAGAEMVTKRRDAGAASYARDATAKALYSQLFEWVVDEINSALEASSGTKVDTLPYIGVLDIFGFESFERNDFEQLLINYTNEALQGTFNRQVFVAEMDLYKREGLIVGNGGMQMPPDNSDCMALLAGTGKVMGVLKVIDAESATPQANDLKMCKQLHRAFEKTACFLKPHPKDIASTFIIRHYAGAIIYTVGRFVEKNVDRLPQEVAKTFEASTVEVVANLFTIKGDKAAAAKRAFGGASILGKFSAQITDLIRTLESTRDSFIRCVKPNPAMVRGTDLSWFDRRYVTQQLKCLSIPQTAEVLKSGLPTRVPYEVLLESYMSVLPAEAVSIWKRLGGGDPKGFMTALFWAFNVPEDAYRTGTTRVFFKSGELSTLDRIMESAGKWVNSPDAEAKAERDAIVKRFKFYYIRTLWRKAIVKTIVCNHMITIFHAVHGREEAAKKLQALERMYAQKKQFTKTKRGAIMAQKMWRAKKARQVAAKLRQEAIEEAKRKAIEAKRLEEEARIRAEAEAKAAEEARIQAEKEQEAARAKADAKALQEAQEKVEAMRAAEAARLLKSEQEAARLKADRERLEEDERKKKEEDEVRKVQEEKEQVELETRFRREEAERMAQEEMAAKAKSLGIASPKAAVAAQRKKSVVREMRKSVVGVTRQEKDQKIRAAEDAILAERTVFGNSGKNGWLQKMEKTGLFGTRKPKAMFCMLKMVGFELEVYQKAASNGLVGEPKGKPYKSFKFSKQQLTCRTLPEDKKLPLGGFMFEVADVKNGAVQLGAASEAERREWMDAIARAQKGFVASSHLTNNLKDAQALQVVGAGGAYEASPEDDFDVTTLPLEAQEQIAKIESLYETGLLTKEEMDQLRPIIIQQGKEQMATTEDEEYDVFPTGDAPRRQTQMGATHGKNAFRPSAQHTSTFQGFGYDQDEGAGAEAMVVCEVCSILNMHGGSACLVCNAQLPRANDPVQQTRVRHHRESMQVVAPLNAGGEFGPPGGKWLCQLPFRNGGTFKCFVKDCASVMDQQTWGQTALYILGCEFTQGMIYQEQWTARHNWTWFEKWHKKAVEVGLLPAGGPAFPKVEAVEATSTNPTTMNKLKDLLSKFLGELFASIKDSETFLNHELSDKMFKIRDNVQQELDFEAYQQIYKEVLSADMSSADSTVPLTREEMEIADDAGTLLITFIRGDGTTKAIDVFDERVQDLHSVCVAAVPRLRASQDVENHLVILELVPHALDVLEHLEKCLSVYNDTLSIAQNKLVMT